MMLEAVQGLNPPTTPKGCRSFARVVDFLSLFFPEIQKVLKPIYDLIRKGRVFQWDLNNKRLLIRLKDGYRMSNLVYAGK